MLKEWLRVTSPGGIIAFTHKVKNSYIYLCCLQLREMLIAHHPHFPELGVRRLGEGAEGNGGPRTLEADIQVKQIT